MEGSVLECVVLQISEGSNKLERRKQRREREKERKKRERKDKGKVKKESAKLLDSEAVGVFPYNFK